MNRNMVPLVGTLLCAALGCETTTSMSNAPPVSPTAEGSEWTSGCPPNQRNTTRLECIRYRPLVPPVVVGPGRIRLLLEPFWAPSVLDPNGKLKDTDHFVVVDVTPQGQEIVASGRCPRAEPTSLSVRHDGSTGILCVAPLAPDTEETWATDAEANYGVLDKASGAVAWQWSARLRRGADEIGVWSSTAFAVDLGPSVIVAWNAEVDCLKGCGPGPLRYQLSSASTSHPLCFEGDDDEPWCVDTVQAAFVDEAGLHLVTSGGTGLMLQYHRFDITPSGVLSHRALDTGTGSEKQRANFCAASDGHSFTLTLPRGEYVEKTGQVRETEHTLRWDDTWLPLGPSVFPAAAPLCYPEVSGQRLVTRHDAVRSDWTVQWVRASRSDAGWVVVYYVPSDEQGHKGASFRIARPKELR